MRIGQHRGPSDLSYGLDHTQKCELRSRRGKIFLFSKASRPAVVPAQPPTPAYHGHVSQGVKRWFRETSDFISIQCGG